MLRRKLYLIITLCLIFIFPLSACADGESSKDSGDKNQITVSFLSDCDAIEGKNTFALNRGDDLKADLTVKDGYSLLGSDHPECAIIGRVGRVSVVMENVRYSMRINLGFEEIKDLGDTQIKYMLNGGKFIGREQETDYFIESGESEFHLRINTNRGVEIIERDGYVLTGWNTLPDGSGEHIGLGSRTTVPEGAELTLYAEWAKETDAAQFEYADNIYTAEAGDCMITKYTGGAADLLVIPKYLGGKLVTRINGDIARSKKIHTLVLHERIDVIRDRAFNGCQIDEVYLYDTISKLTDNAFGEGVKTMHLNAGTDPRINPSAYNSHFAEIIDRLIINADKKKMVVFGGCNLAYGLYSPILAEEYGDEYTIFNIGVNGNTNMTAQLECILSYMKEGDILIHAPEPMGEFTTFYNRSADWILYQMVVHNYDILTHADASGIPGIFDALSEFNETRRDFPPADTETRNRYYNEYGDYLLPRESTGGNFDDGDKYFNFSYINEETLALRNRYYRELTRKGVKVFISCCPLNALGVSEEEIRNEAWAKYDETLFEGIDSDCATIISRSERYIFAGNYFYDTNFHLTLDGAKIRTQYLMEDLQGGLR